MDHPSWARTAGDATSRRAFIVYRRISRSSAGAASHGGRIMIETKKEGGTTKGAKVTKVTANAKKEDANCNQSNQRRCSSQMR
jgi:hypothetical protein